MKVVVKVGTRLLTRAGERLDDAGLGRIAREVADAAGAGHKTVLVTSGAVGAGMGIRGITRRPKRLDEIQALAALGQGEVIARYRAAFAAAGAFAAQVLLTHDDLSDRIRAANARRTLMRLLEWDVVPIVNENDTVGTEELKFGDNDTLAAHLAASLPVDLLVLLTDVEGLLDEEGNRIPLVERLSARHQRLAGSARDDLSLGGMKTKLRAALFAGEAGIPTVIASGRRAGVLSRILCGADEGTRILPPGEKTTRTRRWLLRLARPVGRIHVDAGAVRALVERKASLLSAGVVRVEGDFAAGDAVEVMDPAGSPVARGVAGVASWALRRVCGSRSAEAQERIGKKVPEVIHRDRMAILEGER